ncbi:2-C-methyl-D-erythritol 4-phosphate cytidylyltransferase [Microbacterium sp. MPKO10]|uniref:2-C-methyl-D-erythritol 4-phosphate cytidylyltransferase n=1 Tax=Microbacterium sp. MPKO10 TaxID=2989818 RepID=UPI0022356E08|nr:2-C-methyl-D-erythritol 4-phosphate cytidylyltransferase [Microbacterium sp. MPKO10]MCW4458527.1 2-C-methyl-D-erythritol 4-phosphate cytidylyltransferase [Microbacterium sp. MPKO10]
MPMTVSPRTAVIVVAAGSGTRLAAGEPKAFVELAGRPILARALDPVFRLREPVHVIVVAPPGRLEDAARISRAAAGVADEYVTVVDGGETRQASVAAGLAAVHDSVEIVLVHDAARALTPESQFAAVEGAVSELGIGIVPGLPVADTIKRVDTTESVRDTVDREPLRAVQTPQGFPRALLERAYAAADEPLTDDAGLVSAVGGTIMIIPGHESAFKITTPWDLRRAELLAEETPTFRTGLGIDVHAFDDDRTLWLAGLHWPDEPGLAGHSDGDAVCHAITDALLSAAGLGDIGGMAGTDDPKYENAHGSVFVTEAMRRITASGCRVVNVTAQIMGRRPRFAARRAEAEAELTRLIGAPVSLAATTTDGLGFVGRGEGISVVATALLTAHNTGSHQ